MGHCWPAEIATKEMFLQLPAPSERRQVRSFQSGGGFKITALDVWLLLVPRPAQEPAQAPLRATTLLQGGSLEKLHESCSPPARRQTLGSVEKAM